jgi:hypothetical protein
VWQIFSPNTKGYVGVVGAHGGAPNVVAPPSPWNGSGGRGSGSLPTAKTGGLYGLSLQTCLTKPRVFAENCTKKSKVPLTAQVFDSIIDNATKVLSLKRWIFVEIV